MGKGRQIRTVAYKILGMETFKNQEWIKVVIKYESGYL